MSITLDEVRARADFQMKAIVTPSGKRIWKKSTGKPLAISKVKQDGEDLDQTKYDTYKKKREAQKYDEGVAGGKTMYHPKTGRAKWVPDSETSKYRELKYTNVPAVKAEEVVSEISKKTLGSYIKKATREVSTHSSLEGEYGEREQQKTSSSSDKAYVKRSGDYHFARSEKRQKGIGKAVNKLTKEETGEKMTNRLMSISEMDDAKHAKKQGKIQDTHIIMQLRSAQDLGGKRKVDFRQGGAQEVHPDHIKKILAVHDHPNMRPEHKRKLRVAISKSHGHLKKVANSF